MSYVILAALVGAALLAQFTTRLAGTSVLFLTGLGLVYAGERLFQPDPLRWPLTALGAFLVGVSLLSRVQMWRSSARDRATAHLAAFLFATVGAAALPVYSLGAHADGRLQVALYALVPLLLVVGTMPLLLLDQALAAHPVRLPPGVARRAVRSGLVTALGVALVFPVNYLAQAYNVERDLAYFQVARPGESTRALVGSLAEPVEVLLFFPPANDVARKVGPYFDTLAGHANGQLQVQLLDQAAAPALAEELRVSDNGYVVFRMGDTVERLELSDDIDRARRHLQRLDENVQKHLLEVSRGTRTAYFTVGHGEASHLERDDPQRRLDLFKQLLEHQNFQVRTLGVADGLTDAVPDDADLLIIASPTDPFADESTQALHRYLDEGGRLLVLAEPGEAPPESLMERLGLKVGDAPLANARFHGTPTRTISDRAIIYTNRFGSHEAASTLARHSQRLVVWIPTSAALRETEAGEASRASVLLRSPPETWEDVDGTRQPGDDTTKDIFHVAYALEGPAEAESPWRAAVIGDASVFSDPVVQNRGNQILAMDTVRWLIGEEALAGTVEREDDQRIVHTREQDVAWFYGTIFGVPLLVLATGAVVSRRTRRRT